MFPTLAEVCIGNQQSYVSTGKIACLYGSLLQALYIFDFSLDGIGGKYVCIIDSVEHTVGIYTFLCLVSIQIVVQECQSLGLFHGSSLNVCTNILNSCLVCLISLGRSCDFLLEQNHCIVLCKEVFHFFRTVEHFYHTVILVKQSLFSHNIEVESVSLFHITVENFIELFSVTKGHLGHLVNHISSTLVVTLQFHLIILVFHQTGAHTEVRSGVVGRVQTALVHVNLLVYECPGFGIALGLSVAFEVSAIDSPSTPVALGESLGVTTSYERVEIGRYHITSLEHQIQTFTVVTTTPLGCGISIEQALGAFAREAR